MKKKIFSFLAKYASFCRFWLNRQDKRRITLAEFQQLQKQFKNQSEKGKFFAANFNCRVVIDSRYVRVIKRLQRDFQLKNFVETGTFLGEGSLAMSLLFDRVYTCDIADYKRRPEFYLAENIKASISPSPDFLRKHIDELHDSTLFFLDAHWGRDWPLNEELEIIFSNCKNPVIVIDDFQVGNGLYYMQQGSDILGFDYIASHIPKNYKFLVNPWSNRDCGIVFIFPDSVQYGCYFSQRGQYDEKTHGLWDSEKL